MLKSERSMIISDYSISRTNYETKLRNNSNDVRQFPSRFRLSSMFPFVCFRNNFLQKCLERVIASSLFETSRPLVKVSPSVQKSKVGNLSADCERLHLCALFCTCCCPIIKHPIQIHGISQHNDNNNHNHNRNHHHYYGQTTCYDGKCQAKNERGKGTKSIFFRIVKLTCHRLQLTLLFMLSH